MPEVTGRVYAETEGTETKGRGRFWRKVVIALAVLAALVAAAVVIILVAALILVCKAGGASVLMLVVARVLVVKSWVPEDSMPASPDQLASGLATVARGF